MSKWGKGRGLQSIDFNDFFECITFIESRWWQIRVVDWGASLLDCSRSNALLFSAQTIGNTSLYDYQTNATICTCLLTNGISFRNNDFRLHLPFLVADTRGHGTSPFLPLFLSLFLLFDDDDPSNGWLHFKRNSSTANCRPTKTGSIKMWVCLKFQMKTTTTAKNRRIFIPFDFNIKRFLNWRCKEKISVWMMMFNFFWKWLLRFWLLNHLLLTFYRIPVYFIRSFHFFFFFLQYSKSIIGQLWIDILSNLKSIATHQTLNCK